MYQMKPYLLRNERKMRGWSQTDLALAMGITTRTVMRWELGHAVPFPYHRRKLSILFSKTLQELGLPEEDDENDTFKQVVSPLVPSSVSGAPAQAPFVVDPTIPVHLKTAAISGRRDNLLMLMKQSLFAGDVVFLAALNGSPSINKTPLALAVATDRQVQAHFCHGILWTRLGFHPNVLSVLARWGKLLGVSPSQVKDLHSREAWGQALRAAIRTRKMLLVIDSAASVEDALPLQIGGPECAHLLTTRLSKVAFTFAQQGAIVFSQLESDDGVAILHPPQSVEC
jgi:DNA-binding XRE family transcriptional regulator